MSETRDPLEQKSEELLARFGRARLEPPADMADSVMEAARNPRDGVFREMWRLAAAAAAAVLVVTSLWFGTDVHPVLDRVEGELRNTITTVQEIPRDLQGELRGIWEKSHAPR